MGGGVVSGAQSCPTLCNPMDCNHQAPLSVGFLRQEYRSELLFSLPGDLPNPGIKPTSPALTDDFFTTEPPGKLYIGTISDLCFMKFKVMFAVSFHCKSVSFSFTIIKYDSLWG